MQAVVIEKPYQFVPPYRGTFWIKLLGRLLPRHLRRAWGIESYECRGLEHLQHSLAQKHGILLAPNHCRLSDPMLMGVISFYDVAKSVVDSQNFENKMLKAYIRDWPAEEDSKDG